MCRRPGRFTFAILLPFAAVLTFAAHPSRPSNDALAQSPTPCTTLSFSISPSTLRPGEEFTFFAEGFEPDSLVRFRNIGAPPGGFFDPQYPDGIEVRADATCRVGGFPIGYFGESDPPGTWTFEVSGANNDGGTITLTASLTLAAAWLKPTAQAMSPWLFSPSPTPTPRPRSPGSVLSSRTPTPPYPSATTRPSLGSTPSLSPAGLRSYVEAPQSDTQFPCLRANPSCGRDEWWEEWNESPANGLVEYRFAPGLVTEERYIEAVWLLWQWSEGQELLTAAGENGVRIWTTDRSPGSFAGYSSVVNGITVDVSYAPVSTWMLADLLAHELRHAADAASLLANNRSAERCISAEQRAYETEARYLTWLSARMGGLPSRTQVSSRLSGQDLEVYAKITEIGSSSDPAALAARHYRESCG